MKRIVVVLILVLASATLALAGNVSGTITEAGKPIAKGTKIEITCGAKNYPAELDANGAYKIFVAEMGKCVLKVNYQGEAPTFEISSYEGSVQYDLSLEKKDGKYTLKRK
jgi:hypothetical protein